MNLNMQFATMGMMLLGGLSLGGLFDFYKILANHFRMPRYAYYLWDVVFWILGTLLVFTLLYEINWGQVRVFIFLGLFVGICLYFWIFSRFVVRLMLKLLLFVQWLIRIGILLVNVVVVTPVLLLYRAGVMFFGFLMATAIFLYQVMIQLLHAVWKVLLWLTSPWIMYVRRIAKNNKAVQVIIGFIHRLFDRK